MAFRKSRVRSASAPPIKSSLFTFSDIGEWPDCPHSVRFCHERLDVGLRTAAAEPRGRLSKMRAMQVRSRALSFYRLV